MSLRQNNDGSWSAAGKQFSDYSAAVGHLNPGYKEAFASQTITPADVYSGNVQTPAQQGQAGYWIDAGDGNPARHTYSKNMMESMLRNAQGQGYSATQLSAAPNGMTPGDAYTGVNIYNPAEDPRQQQILEAYKGFVESNPQFANAETFKNFIAPKTNTLQNTTDPKAVAFKNPELLKNNLIPEKPFDVNTLQNQLLEAQREKALADLNKSYSSQIATIDDARAVIDPRYQKAGVQTSVNAELAKKRLREQLAAQGLARSGATVSAQLGVTNAMQGALGELEGQRMSEHDQLTRSQQQLGANFEFDKASAVRGIEAQAIQNAIEQSRWEQDKMLEQSRFETTHKLDEAKFQESIKQNGLDYALKERALKQEASIAAANRAAKDNATPQLSKADSLQNYHDSVEKINDAINNKNASKGDLLNYAGNLVGYLSESDYLKLLNYINTHKNFQPKTSTLHNIGLDFDS